MPMNPVIEDPDFNGVRYSRTSCSLLWGAYLVAGWKSFDVKAPLKPGKTWGNRAKPGGRTTGKFDPSGECEIYLEYWVNLRNILTAIGALVGRGYKQVSIPVVTFTAFEVERGTVVTQLLGVRVADVDVSVSDSSDDQLTAKLSLDIMDVIEDGAPSVIDTVPIF
jgi:hypothetical protein